MMRATNIIKKRCAIYARKSVEDGLEQEFNSLDAQREAGEAYILSQKANGWICLPERYDDGGYSGGNMKRPALQKLLNDCENGLVDIIVVYKIDRLSRSICDFADLTKKFDEWGVQFVAVTQEINTATSAGRMMLNILITFAQYEREVITERVRDKMSASRKKGLWVGGCVPFGYTVCNKKLIVNQEEAKTVQRIFQRFVEIQSPKLIAHELNLDGIKTKQGKSWCNQHIYRILNNHTYIGEVKYKDTICEGEQEGIVDLEIWNRTRAILAENNPCQDHSSNMETLAPLKGILRCGHCGGAMMPTYARKGSRKYFYYLCSKGTKTSEQNCPVHQIPAGDVEELVRTQIRRLLSEPGMIARFAEKSNLQLQEIRDFFQESFWSEITPGEENRLIRILVEKAIVWEDRLEIEIKTSGIRPLMEKLKND